MQNHFLFALFKVEFKAKKVYSQTLFGGMKTRFHVYFSVWKVVDNPDNQHIVWLLDFQR